MTVEDSDITRIESQLQRIENKLDAQESRFVLHVEYAANNTALHNDIQRLELDQKAKEKDRDIELKELRSAVESNKSALWKEIALSLIGLLTGGGIIGFISYFHMFTGR